MTQVKNGLSWLLPFQQNKFLFPAREKTEASFWCTPFSLDHATPALSHREESAEKRPVAAQCKTEILC